MTIETAEQVSKLLEKKSEYTKDLSRLLSNDYDFRLDVEARRSFSPHSFNLAISKDKNFNAEIKEIVIKKIEEEVSKIDEEIKNLKCE